MYTNNNEYYTQCNIGKAELLQTCNTSPNHNNRTSNFPKATLQITAVH